MYLHARNLTTSLLLLQLQYHTRIYTGVSGLIRKLASADPGKVMEALRAIIAAAKRGSPRFAREFNRWAWWAG